MMDFFDVIKNRHSYRSMFEPVQIPREELKKIVMAGIDAPAAYNRQTTEFLIIDDPILLEKLGAIVDKVHFHTARAVILCMTNTKLVPDDFPFALQNLSVAAENILLAITASGYASVWSDQPLLAKETAEKIQQLFDLPPYLKPEVLLPVGKPSEERKPQPKPPFEELAWFNAYPASDRFKFA